ncbi:MAG: hypothetical protein NZZ60_00440 [Bacteroidia bacterium]|nr:hypothetical protein [Bacteroidia bacterium]MCX7651568.1 hypothetical protein [Bacteroidia bacterium]MDW8417256.1 hypothetical protein [Bacteroidia bacterium]
MKHKQVAQGALWNAAGYLLGGSLAVLYPVLFVYWLGRSAYGLVSYLALIVSQSYLLNLGLGEAMAQRLTVAVSRGNLSEGIAFVRAALTGVWLMSAGLGLWWMIFGVEGLCLILPLEAAGQRLLYSSRAWLPPAMWGIQTGMLLSWIPIALGRFRSAAAHTLLQTLWQAFFPLFILAISPMQSPETALKSIFLGYFLYGLSMWILAWRWLSTYPLPGQIALLGPLLKKSIWSGLQGIGAIPYTFTERTLIGRWASLELMGFYSAVHFILSKAIAIAVKGLESLFPVFGSVADSPTRQVLRLSQTVWFISLGAGILTLGALGSLALLLLLLPVRIELHERVILGMGIGFFVAQLPIIPITTFLQSRGYFRQLFWINLLPIAAVLLLSPIFVAYRLFFLANIFGAVGWMVIYIFFTLEGKTARALWRAWVLPTYGKMLLVCGVGIAAYIFLPKYIGREVGTIGAAASLWGLAVGLILSEKSGSLWGAKRDLLFQTLLSVRGLAQSMRGGFFRPLRKASPNNR